MGDIAERRKAKCVCIRLREMQTLFFAKRAGRTKTVSIMIVDARHVIPQLGRNEIGTKLKYIQMLDKLAHLGIGYALTTGYARRHRTIIIDVTSLQGLAQGRADLNRLLQDVDGMLEEAENTIIARCDVCNGYGWVWGYTGTEPHKEACPACGEKR